jgi:hypothetical protein
VETDIKALEKQLDAAGLRRLPDDCPIGSPAGRRHYHLTAAVQFWMTVMPSALGGGPGVAWKAMRFMDVRNSGRYASAPPAAEKSATVTWAPNALLVLTDSTIGNASPSTRSLAASNGCAISTRPRAKTRRPIRPSPSGGNEYHARFHRHDGNALRRIERARVQHRLAGFGGARDEQKPPAAGQKLRQQVAAFIARAIQFRQTGKQSARGRHAIEAIAHQTDEDGAIGIPRARQIGIHGGQYPRGSAGSVNHFQFAR